MNRRQLLSILAGICAALLTWFTPTPYSLVFVSFGTALFTSLLLARNSKLRKEFGERLETAEGNLGLAVDEHKKIFQKYSALLGFKQVFSSQLLVDEHLEGLAQALKEAFDREIKRQSCKDFEEYLEQVESLKERVRRAKDAFWEAHGFAKAVGYRVYDKFTDYLWGGAPPKAS